MAKDMTLAQFRDALKRNGMKAVGFMGYVEVGRGLSVSMLNANTKNRRARLAYLLSKQSEAEEKYQAELDDENLREDRRAAA